MKIRAFVAIDIPESLKKEIKKIQEKLLEFKGKITETENLHLTLKFLGWISEETIGEIKKRLRKIRFNQFNTKIDSIGIFDNTKHGDYTRQIVVWLHLTNTEQLQKEIDLVLSPLFEKERRFMSHLTIARVKDAGNKKEFFSHLKKIKIKPLDFAIKNFRLKKSVLKREGPRYETIEEYPLI